MSTDELREALVAADWWAGRAYSQPDHSVTEMCRVLSDAVRRLQDENEVLQQQLARFTNHA